MRVQDLAQLSTRMFKTNPLRTWLTILGMGVGTGAVVVLVGFSMYGVGRLVGRLDLVPYFSLTYTHTLLLCFC